MSRSGDRIRSTIRARVPPSSLPRHAWARSRLEIRELRRSWQYRRVLRRLAGPKLLRAFSDAYPRAFFIEIGANDGEEHDHIRPLVLTKPWRGIMVEPVPYVFERLRRNYGALDRIALENVAIADRDGEMPFYYLAEAPDAGAERLPDWYHGVGSFSRETVLGHGDRIPDIEQRVVSATVPCLTFESLCRQHAVSNLDLLLLDTEGYDYEILKGIDFDARRPRMVVYEHYHLSPDERSACSARLREIGYETMEEGFDTWCLDASIADALTRQWRGVRPGVPGSSAHDEARA